MTASVPAWALQGPGETSYARQDVKRPRGVSPLPVVPELERPSMAQLPGRVTSQMIDEAVEKVVRAQGWSASTANVLRYNMAHDTGGDVTQAYFASRIAEERLALRGVGQRELVIRYVLTDEQVTALTEYAPEFRLRFRSTDSHDHAMAAAMRIIDQRILDMRCPYGVSRTDVGGNPMVYVKHPEESAHVCGPLVDVKDPMRHRLRRLEAEQILGATADSVVRERARGVLGHGDGTFVCGKRAQDCEFQSRVLTAVHVYDIKLTDWPAIMEQKGAVVVEGCLLFSDVFWEESAGDLQVSGARYEIDFSSDEFRMGFSGSPSWWYRHKWSDFVLYGADQELHTEGSTYAYKVVERRGDTLFFRILRLGDRSAGVSPGKTVYRTPGVPVVHVDGFALTESSGWLQPSMQRKEYYFPANLWREMLAQASEDFERGVLDYNKMYNHYRTISVRQTVNAVLVMGGERVSQAELMPLVVHVCLAAAGMCLLGQRETRLLTARELAVRARVSESTYVKVGKALAALASATMLAPLSFFRKFSDVLTSQAVSELERWVLDWQPVWGLTTIESSRLVAGGTSARGPSMFGGMMRDAAAAFRVVDPTSLAMQDDKLREAFGKLCPHVQLPASQQPVRDEPACVGTESVAGRSDAAPPSYVTEVSGDVEEARREAIREHLVEIDMSNAATTTRLAGAYRVLAVSGKPDEDALRSRAELYKNPDMWRVERGVVVGKSCLGFGLETFRFSAVYTVTPDDSGSNIRAVHRQPWEGQEAGAWVRRDHYVLSDERYSGWVMVNDELVVYNGQEIIDSLTKALTLSHSYVVTLRSAPPGSGKTYEIVHSAAADGSDCVMCPVRESILDTRQQLLALHEHFPGPKLRVRTLDSYLVGMTYAEATQSLRARRLLGDECFMTHAAKWYAAAALLGVRELLVYGDDKQIPHIPRAQAPSLHVRVIPQSVADSWVTRRCPASGVAAWGHLYQWRVRTVSEEQSGMVQVKSVAGRQIPSGCVMMGMYQADKPLLRRKYAGVEGIKIMTAHESEGKTFDHVWLHRFDIRRRAKEDRSSLFDQEPHVLVAMSRHRKSFTYVFPGDVTDLVAKWIEQSKDPRRLAAVKDVKTAGTPCEFL